MNPKYAPILSPVPLPSPRPTPSRSSYPSNAACYVCSRGDARDLASGVPVCDSCFDLHVIGWKP